MARKSNSIKKSEPTYPSGVIASKAVGIFENTTSHDKQNVTNGIDRHERIAMAAYYRSQNRDFNNGDEIQDWLEAEADIDGLI